MVNRLIATLLLLCLPCAALAAADQAQDAMRLPGIGVMLGQYGEGMTAKDVEKLEGAPPRRQEVEDNHTVSYFYYNWAAAGFDADDVCYYLSNDTGFVYMTTIAFEDAKDAEQYEALRGKLVMLLGEPLHKGAKETRWETPMGSILLAIPEEGEEGAGAERLTLTCAIGEQPPESLL